MFYGKEWISEGSWGKGPEFGFEVMSIGNDKYALKSDEHDGNQGYNTRSIRLFLLESGIPEVFQFDKDNEFWCFLDELNENNEEIYYSNSCSKYLSFYPSKNSDYYNIRIDMSSNDDPCKVLRSSFDCDENIEFYEFSSTDRKYILVKRLDKQTGYISFEQINLEKVIADEKSSQNIRLNKNDELSNCFVC